MEDHIKPCPATQLWYGFIYKRVIKLVYNVKIMKCATSGYKRTKKNDCITGNGVYFIKLICYQQFSIFISYLFSKLNPCFS